MNNQRSQIVTRKATKKKQQIPTLSLLSKGNTFQLFWLIVLGSISPSLEHVYMTYLWFPYIADETKYTETDVSASVANQFSFLFLL